MVSTSTSASASATIPSHCTKTMKQTSITSAAAAAAAAASHEDDSQRRRRRRPQRCDVKSITCITYQSFVCLSLCTLVILSHLPTLATAWSTTTTTITPKTIPETKAARILYSTAATATATATTIPSTTTLTRDTSKRRFPTTMSIASASRTSRLSSSDRVPTIQQPSMFFNSPIAPMSVTMPTTIATDQRRQRPKSTFPIRDDAQQGGAVLGFDVSSLLATPSSVDMDTWGTADASSSILSSSPTSSTATATTATATTTTSMVSMVELADRWALADEAKSQQPAWLPWIPTKAQIESLKVVELKQACLQRGLKRSGNKSNLQERLWTWTSQQQQQHQELITGDFLTRCFEEDSGFHQMLHSSNPNYQSLEEVDPFRTTTSNATATAAHNTYAPNSLAEWARTVDLEPLLQRRKEIHRQKREGKKNNKKHPQKKGTNSYNRNEYLQSLTRSLRAASTTASPNYASNIQVKELYAASKQADQLGEPKVAIDLLNTLLAVAPSDARTYRRLSRMYSEQGDIDKARATLQTGIRRLPENPWLWHGLGQLELKQGSSEVAKVAFSRAMDCDPAFAHSYHALGTLLHSQGEISQALKVLQKGLQFSPQNHRLWHAYGDLYRTAHMLKDAKRSYKRALEHSPPVSQCFAFSSLATVAYEQGDLDETRHWLHKSLQVNNGRHAQGWVKLIQLEESEGNVQRAMQLCAQAIGQYEEGLIQARQRYLRQGRQNNNNRNGRKHHHRSHQQEEASATTPVVDIMGDYAMDVTKALLSEIPRYRNGDKFLSVYRNWARLAQEHSHFQLVDQIYDRASLAFPKDYKLTLEWANYHNQMMNLERARNLFALSCEKAGSRHAEPYRQYAELEMSQSNYQEARRILFRGATAITQTMNGALGQDRGLPAMYHTWAICEWHLGNPDRAQVLLDHALRLTPPSEDSHEASRTRSILFYSMAHLEAYKGRPYVAQHFIGLTLKENALPLGRRAGMWKLWGRVAETLDNPKLQQECLDQARAALEEIKSESSSSSSSTTTLSSQVRQEGGTHWMKKDPWQHKLFGSSSSNGSKGSDFTSNLRFPKSRTSATVPPANRAIG